MYSDSESAESEQQQRDESGRRAARLHDNEGVAWRSCPHPHPHPLAPPQGAGQGGPDPDRAGAAEIYDVVSWKISDTVRLGRGLAWPSDRVAGQGLAGGLAQQAEGRAGRAAGHGAGRSGVGRPRDQVAGQRGASGATAGLAGQTPEGAGIPSSPRLGMRQRSQPLDQPMSRITSLFKPEIRGF